MTHPGLTAVLPRLDSASDELIRAATAARDEIRKDTTIDNDVRLLGLQLRQAAYRSDVLSCELHRLLERTPPRAEPDSQPACTRLPAANAPTMR